jgi:hypothetical protein
MRKQSPAFRFVRIGWREAATTQLARSRHDAEGRGLRRALKRKPLAECQLFGCGTILM